MTLPVHTHLLLRVEFAMCIRPDKLLYEGDSVVAFVNWTMFIPIVFCPAHSGLCPILNLWNSYLCPTSDTCESQLPDTFTLGVALGVNS